MSLNSTITQLINDHIKNIILKISEKYNIEEKELFSLVNEKFETRPNIQTEEKKEFILTEEMILKASAVELKAMCKSKGYKCSGTKEVLVFRLLGKEENPSPKNKPKSTPSKPVKPVLNKIQTKVQESSKELIIKRNEWNNFVHVQSQLVFDNDTKCVIGKQKSDGSIEQLNADHIDMCNAFKFKYKLPSNLDNKKSLADVKVVELEEGDEEEEEEEEEDEDIEDIEIEEDDDEDLDLEEDELDED